jgi:RNA polymerase sigma factor (sigma-70 family)
LILTEKELINRCQQQDRVAQKWLYDRYSAKMFSVCRRYVPRREDAEDVLIEAFFKIFENMNAFRYTGSFEGWMRRIVVNEALMFLRKNRLLTVEPDASELNTLEMSVQIGVEQQMAAQEILKLLEKLPTGYRTIFNLYVIEGFKHQEIADMLNISINTSKSQLILAKDRLRKLYVVMNDK